MISSEYEINKVGVSKLLGRIIMICGLIGSFIMGHVIKTVDFITSYGYTYYKYNWGLVLLGIAGSLIFGAIFIFLSDLLKIAEDNHIMLKALCTEFKVEVNDFIEN